MLILCIFKKNQPVFSARFDKQDEDNQVMEETKKFNNFNMNQNFTESDIDNFDVYSPIKHQIKEQEMKNSVWRSDKNTSMTR